MTIPVSPVSTNSIRNKNHFRIDIRMNFIILVSVNDHVIGFCKGLIIIGSRIGFDIAYRRFHCLIILSPGSVII